jgi:uncharacterized protein YbcI
MNEARLSMAQKVARVAGILHCARTGYAPKAVTAALTGDMLVITLHDALTPAMEALARSPEGAPRVQAYYRQFFANSADSLRREIKRITGVAVRVAVAEVHRTAGTVVQAFVSGSMIQVSLLARGLSEEVWKGHRPCAASDTESRESLEPVRRAVKTPRRKVREELEAQLTTV